MLQLHTVMFQAMMFSKVIFFAQVTVIIQQEALNELHWSQLFWPHVLDQQVAKNNSWRLYHSLLKSGAVR
jgi:hypothetical protein